ATSSDRIRVLSLLSEPSGETSASAKADCGRIGPSLRRERSLLRASPGQHRHQAVIALVTPWLRVDSIRFVALFLEVECHRPGLRPHGRILDRDGITKRFRVDAHPPFNEVQILVRPLEIRLRREIRDIDDQRLAVPATARVTPPEPDAGRKM